MVQDRDIGAMEH